MNRRSIALFVLFLAACGGNVVVDATSPSSSASVSSSSTGVGGSLSSATVTPAGGLGGFGVGNPSSSTVTPAGGLGGFGGFGGIQPSVSSSGGGCLTRPPAGSLSLCGASASGAGGSPQCDSVFCQSGSQNRWEADCQGASCTCTLNGVQICSCAVSGGDFCTSNTNCCGFGQ